MPKQLHCTFCDRARNEVRHLVSGRVQDVFMCDRCVNDALRTITAEDKKAASTSSAPVKDTLRKPQEIKAHLDQYVVGQDKAKRALSIAIYNHYKRRFKVRSGVASTVEIEKSNILLAGPSGTGKTHLARSIAKFLGLPFFVGDANKMTQAGYVGDDAESVLQGLVSDADGDVERAQWGVVFLDECDKIARKSGRGASGYRDVTGEGVQQALLKLVEGTKVLLPRGMGAKLVSADLQPTDMFDTTNTLFIFSGSFAGIEDIVERRIHKAASIGFGAASREKLSQSDIYEHITEEDILEFGLIPELVGRLPVLTTTLELSTEDIVHVLTKPKNAIVRQFQALFEMDNIDLRFTDDALRAIGVEAKKRPTGCRALRGILEKVLEPYSFEAPSDPTIESILITEEAVGGSPAVISRRGASEVSPAVPVQLVGG